MKKFIFMMILILFIFGLFNSLVSAIDVNLGPVLKIYDSAKKEMNLNDVDRNKDLIFKTTLTNQYNDIWLCSKSITFTLKINKNGDKFGLGTLSKSIGGLSSNQGEICLAPNSEFEMWIFFDDYNKLDLEQRIGNWHIEPGVSGSYDCKDENGKYCQVNIRNPQQGNSVDFTVIKENPSTNLDVNNLKKNFYEGWEFWVLSIGGGIVIILTIIGLLRKRR